MLTYDEGEKPVAKSHIFGVGDTLRVRCHGCPQWFTWVVPELWWDSVPHHHSKNCKNRHGKQRIRKQERDGFRCPTPFKKTHATWDSGREEARKQAIGKNLLYGAYRCDCGGIHVGHADFSVVKRVS